MAKSLAELAEQVDFESSYYRSMKTVWQLIQDLRGGTEAMRKAGTRWLPKESKEAEVDYRIRLNRSILYAAYDDSINRITSLPFSKAITLKNIDKQDERIRALITDIDGEGQTLQQFGRAMFDMGVDNGAAFVFVSYPTTGGDLSIADEKALDIRPTFTLISPSNVLGYQSVTINGVNHLTQFRFKTQSYETYGSFGEVIITRIWVITPDSYTIYAKRETGDRTTPTGFKEESSGVLSLGYIPVVAFYTNRKGFFEARPALEALAWLNVGHWQSSSDQSNILKYARVPFLFASGFSDEEAKKGITIGPDRVTFTTNEQAKLGFVEPSGGAIASGRQELMDIIDQMETVGLKPLVRRSIENTAFGRQADEKKIECEAQAWVRECELTLEAGIWMAADWLKTPVTDDFAVQIFSEFSISQQTAVELQQLFQARMSKQITQRTYLTELQKRSLISDDISIDQEIQDTKDEGSMGAFGGTNSLNPDGQFGQEGKV